MVLRISLSGENIMVGWKVPQVCILLPKYKVCDMTDRFLLLYAVPPAIKKTSLICLEEIKQQSKARRSVIHTGKQIKFSRYTSVRITTVSAASNDDKWALRQILALFQSV
jgi:hypothetical protein